MFKNKFNILVENIKTNTRFKRLLVLFSVLFIISILSSVAVVNYISYTLYRERTNSLLDTTAACSKTLDTVFEENRKIVNIFENIVVHNLPENKSVQVFIEKINSTRIIDSNKFFLVDSTGKYYSSDFKVGKINNAENYSLSSNEQLEYLSTLPHMNKHNTYLIIRTRIKNSITAYSYGKKISVNYCAVMFDLSDLNATLDSLYPGDNNTLIFKSKDGSVLYRHINLNVDIRGSDIYDDVKNSDFLYMKSDDIISKAEHGTTFVAEAIGKSNHYYFCSAPLNVSDWSLMFIVGRDNIDVSSGSGFKTIIYLVIGAISLFFLVSFSIIAIIYNNKTRRKNEKTQFIINALSEDFVGIALVPFNKDKTIDEAIDYRLNDILLTYLPGVDKISSFTKRLDMIRDVLVVPEEQDIFIAQTRREVILQKLNTEPAYYVTFKVNVDNEIKYSQIQFSLIKNENGEPYGMVAGYRDIDNEMKEKIAMQDSLKIALDEANSASKAKSSFLFNMSHDIRTPLNAILGFTKMASRDITDKDKVIDSLQKISKSGDILLSLINDVLEMSSIENGKVKINATERDISTIFDNIIPVMKDLAKAKKITVSYSFGNIVNKYVFVDNVRLQRILINLISNAVKYTNNGGFVDVTCCQKTNEFENFATYVFSVKDNGIGMSEEFQKHLFEEFTREENSTTTGVQGTGLGLSIVKHFTDLMGGEISCISEQGVGTEFILTMPFKIADNRDFEGITNDSKDNVSLLGLKVLLVDDNELNREIAADILSEEGLIVTTAIDGVESVEILKEKGPEFFDFVLMDVQMPIMNGYETSEKIIEMYPDNDIVIIALSANAFEEDKQKSIASGMKDHIAKPINVNNLLSVLKKYVK